MAAVNSVNSGPEEQRNNTNMAHRRCWPLLFYSSHCSKYPQSFFIKCPIILHIDFFRFLEVYLTKLSMLTNLCILSKRILVQHFKNVQKGSTMIPNAAHEKKGLCVHSAEKKDTQSNTAGLLLPWTSALSPICPQEWVLTSARDKAKSWVTSRTVGIS